MARPTKLRTFWNTVQTAAGLGTALVILVAFTPLATGTNAPTMTAVAPTTANAPASVSSARALDGQGLRAPTDESGAHQAHITNAQ